MPTFGWMFIFGVDTREGDMEMLQAAKPDFLGINYYQSGTIKFNPLDGVGHRKMNTIGQKGSGEESGLPGMFKRVANPFVERTNWDWEIDPTGLQIALPL